MSLREIGIVAMALCSACGRLGFDALAGDLTGDATTGDSLAIVGVDPMWAPTTGGAIAVELAGDLDGVTIELDGVPCGAPVREGQTIHCVAPPHAPSRVTIEAIAPEGIITSADAERMRMRMRMRMRIGRSMRGFGVPVTRTPGSTDCGDDRRTQAV